MQGEEPKSDEWCVKAKITLLNIVDKIALPNRFVTGFFSFNLKIFVTNLDVVA